MNETTNRRCDRCSNIIPQGDLYKAATASRYARMCEPCADEVYGVGHFYTAAASWICRDGVVVKDIGQTL